MRTQEGDVILDPASMARELATYWQGVFTARRVDLSELPNWWAERREEPGSLRKEDSSSDGETLGQAARKKRRRQAAADAAGHGNPVTYRPSPLPQDSRSFVITTY